jgi:hypothetical protein
MGLRFIALAIASVIGAGGVSLVHGQAYSGGMRALITPNAAVDSETYARYQQCLAKVSLTQNTQLVTEAREACKRTALKSAYRIPSESAIKKESSELAEIPSVKDRTAAQQMQLRPFK